MDVHRQWNAVNSFRWIRRVARGNATIETLPNGLLNVSIGFIVYGFAVTYLLSFLTAQYVWWPISPIGYFLGINYHVVWMVWGFMIAWFIKLLIMRYGGLQTYRKFLPVFLGMILGSVLLEIFDAALVLIVG